jgi:cell division cycle protein 20 (cofactor of APC complex)
MIVIACVSYSFLPSKQLDRFIPNRSAMDFDFAHYMLIEGRQAKGKPPASSLAAEAYRKRLTEVFNMNRTRILAFKNKTLAPVELIPHEFSYSLYSDMQMKPWRHILRWVYDFSLSWILSRRNYGFD